MIILRELKKKDAPLMIEWMHDPYIQKGFKRDMMGATMEDAEEFIKKSQHHGEAFTGSSIHYAIADKESDEYLGTVSLKNIDRENGTAEYAIIIRKKAQKSGVGSTATGLVLDKAFSKFGLNRVYLSVYSNNAAAIKLYEKCGFKYEGEFRDHFLIDGQRVGWKWYGILKDEYKA